VSPETGCFESPRFRWGPTTSAEPQGTQTPARTTDETGASPEQFADHRPDRAQLTTLDNALAETRSGVLARRGRPAILAAGGLDGCGRAGRVRHDGDGSVPVPVRRSRRTAAVDRRPIRLNDCKDDYAIIASKIMPPELTTLRFWSWVIAVIGMGRLGHGAGRHHLLLGQPRPDSASGERSRPRPHRSLIRAGGDHVAVGAHHGRGRRSSRGTVFVVIRSPDHSVIGARARGGIAGFSVGPVSTSRRDCCRSR
jgi:hypothetical protein